MPRLSDQVRGALGDWWTLAMDAGFGGYSATETVSAASDLAQQFGQQFSFQTSQAVATLFGYARRMSNASTAVQMAENADYILPQHIAIPPWARDEREMNASPIWHATYVLTTINAEGQEENEFKTSKFNYNFPQTIGEMKDAITEDGQALAAKYGRTFVSSYLTGILAI